MSSNMRGLALGWKHHRSIQATLNGPSMSGTRVSASSYCSRGMKSIFLASAPSFAQQDRVFFRGIEQVFLPFAFQG